MLPYFHQQLVPIFTLFVGDLAHWYAFYVFFLEFVVPLIWLIFFFYDYLTTKKKVY
jgi:hypothetical protein